MDSENSAMTSVVDSSILAQLLAKLRKHEDAYPFLRPVDWKKLDLHDYPHIVSRPMDLQTVGRRLRDGQFSDPVVVEFLNDLQLIWNNCRLYNDEKTEIYAMADRMESYMLELIKEMLPADVQVNVHLESNTQMTGTQAAPTDQRQKRRRTVGRRASEESSTTQEAVATPPPRKSVKKSATGRGPGRPRKSAGAVPRPSVPPEDYEMTDESDRMQLKSEEALPEGRKALLAKFIRYCQRLNRVQTAQLLCMISKEMGSRLPADTLTVPNPVIPARGRRPASQLCVLNLDLLEDRDVRRICSVMKLFARHESNNNQQPITSNQATDLVE
eukprot:Gregarina_sp_Pseudo_9__2121@NODE_247_length_3444_cov_52_284581_g230_i0_p2_GENE_NODE_247_length_3444_cov_52_284581_g230_i0NODE_247_length_3444_cov_52_284581_g230_i0_p2_ORF_typecomplete_len328_score66_82Bromodomain/PF00439_25/1_2e23Bromodomain/PF00439_25/8_8e02_NODE_247_length_3444_cov_52_284581_g230_i010542037